LFQKARERWHNWCRRTKSKVSYMNSKQVNLSSALPDFFQHPRPVSAEYKAYLIIGAAATD
jgi:hypothetical protein